MKTTVLGTLLSAALSLLSAAENPSCFSAWPEGASPAEVGKLVAENVLPRKFRFETMPEDASLGVIYPEVISWYGALTVAALTRDTDLRDRLVKKFEPFLGEPGSQRFNRKAMSIAGCSAPCRWQFSSRPRTRRARTWA